MDQPGSDLRALMASNATSTSFTINATTHISVVLIRTVCRICAVPALQSQHYRCTCCDCQGIITSFVSLLLLCHLISHTCPILPAPQTSNTGVPSKNQLTSCWLNAFLLRLFRPFRIGFHKFAWMITHVIMYTYESIPPLLRPQIVGQVFDQIFGQVFDQIFDQVFPRKTRWWFEENWKKQIGEYRKILI